MIVFCFMQQRVAARKISSIAATARCVLRRTGNVTGISTAGITVMRRIAETTSSTGKAITRCAPRLTSRVRQKTSVSTSRGSVTVTRTVLTAVMRGRIVSSLPLSYKVNKNVCFQNNLFSLCV